MWITIVVGVVALVLCCGGGIFGVGALIYSQSRALPAQASAVVTNYLEALRVGDYGKAYDQLCGELHNRVSLDEFSNRERHQPQVTSYTISVVRISGSEVLVDAEVWVSSSRSQMVRYHLIQDQQAGGLRICGSG